MMVEIMVVIMIGLAIGGAVMPFYALVWLINGEFDKFNEVTIFFSVAFGLFEFFMIREIFFKGNKNVTNNKANEMSSNVQKDKPNVENVKIKEEREHYVAKEDVSFSE